MEYLGNQGILKHRKIGFLCSRKVPASIILKTYDWVIEQRNNGICVISGFHSKIEKDVFDILVKGTPPIILILARGMYKRLPDKLRIEIDKNRLLIISPFSKLIKRASNSTSLKRNKCILSFSDEMYLPYVNPQGSLSRLVQKYNIKTVNN